MKLRVSLTTLRVSLSRASGLARGADCQVGRPFRVEGADRVAPIAARTDWSLLPEGPQGAEALPEGLRAELGAYWAKLGQMEHASVAAFARFTLQLLALGAPPELVAGAQTAMSDELEHARLCFGLAQEILGRPVGPGPLGLEGALGGASLADVVQLAVVEGCVGETIAALEAAEAHDYATVPGVEVLLARVWADEQRHAELAWRFVRWALEAGEPGVRELAAAAFTQALDEADGPASEAGDLPSAPSEAEAQALAFGRLSERMRAQLRRRVLREVVGPCAEQLLTATERFEQPPQSASMSAEA